jgi:hypothetical protein
MPLTFSPSPEKASAVPAGTCRTPAWIPTVELEGTAEASISVPGVAMVVVEAGPARDSGPVTAFRLTRLPDTDSIRAPPGELPSTITPMACPSAPAAKLPLCPLKLMRPEVDRTRALLPRRMPACVVPLAVLPARAVPITVRLPASVDTVPPLMNTPWGRAALVPVPRSSRSAPPVAATTAPLPICRPPASAISVSPLLARNWPPMDMEPSICVAFKLARFKLPPVCWKLLLTVRASEPLTTPAD